MRAPDSLRRRRLLQGAGTWATLAVAPLTPARAASAPDLAGAFAAKTFGDAIAALGGMPQPSERIVLTVPELADNGAIVPLTVASDLPGTREILILVDGNPQPLAARFAIPDGTEPAVATRIRMAQSGTVYAVARTGEGLFATARSTRVLVGGCG